MTVLQAVLIMLAFAGVVGIALASLYKNNRLLFWCLAIAFAAHVLCVGGLWAVGRFWPEKKTERRIAVTIQAPLPPKELKKEEVIEEQPVCNLSLPLGKPDGDRKVKKIKKGTTLDPRARPGASGEKTFGNQHTLSSPSDGGPGDVANDPDAKGDIFGPGASLDVKDLNNIGRPGGGGQEWGTPDGDPNGGIPAGFANGTVNGRVYFIRLKYGVGAGYMANNDGIKRLLSFLNRTFPCQAESWPMTVNDLKKKYLDKGAHPSFLYAYCDDNFTLTSNEVLVLREYLNKGGFLFLDSRCDPDIKDQVARELDKLLPGMRLAPLPASHLVYRFLYVFDPPVPVGLNLFDKQNYGITKDSRLCVFYSMGDLSYLYTVSSPDADTNIDRQYQLGANVMLYAINGGNPSGFDKIHVGATVISTEVLEKAGLLTPGTASAKPKVSGESVKIKHPGTTPGQNGDTAPAMPDEPDEIKIIE